MFEANIQDLPVVCGRGCRGGNRAWSLPGAHDEQGGAGEEISEPGDSYLQEDCFSGYHYSRGVFNYLNCLC